MKNKKMATKEDLKRMEKDIKKWDEKQDARMMKKSKIKKRK